MAFLEALGTAFLLTFLAEFGDKTQLVVVALAARGKRMAVFVGAALAEILLVVLAVAAAGLVAAYVPQVIVGLVAGLLFLVFGVLQVREALEKEEDEVKAETKGRSVLWSTFGLIAIAELGDKTQLTVAGLAATSGEIVATTLGGIAGLVGMTAIGAAAGGLIGAKVPARVVKWIAAVLFLAAGVWILVSTLL